MGGASSTSSSSESSSCTISGNVHIEHIWLIEDFSVLLTSFSQKHSLLNSVLFSPPGNDELEFSIWLFPYGMKEEHKDSVAIYLRLLKWQEEDVNIKQSFAILKADGRVFRSETGYYTFTQLESFGFGMLVKHDELLRNAGETLPGDVLTIRCEVNTINGQALESDQDTSALMQLSNECIGQLTEDWSSLFTTKEGSDVTLLFDDGKQIKAHKLVLSTRSSVFKVMLEKNCICKEKTGSKVAITDVDLDVFKEFLRFLYTGKVEIGENGFELMEISDRYATESLKTLCVYYLASKLTNETVVPILIKADKHSAKELKAKAIEFIICNFASIEKTENWDAPLEVRPKLYLEVVYQIKASMSPNHN